jgi:hypothetical protein
VKTVKKEADYMGRRFTKQAILWIFLSLPAGVAAGALVSAFWGQNSDIDRFTAAFNGGLSGAWIALIGAFAAAGTNAVAHDRLKAAGGSWFLTGLVISYGLIATTLGLLLLL